MKDIQREKLALECEGQMLMRIHGISKRIHFTSVRMARKWCFEHRHVTISQIAPFLSEAERNELYALVEKPRKWRNYGEISGNCPKFVIGTLYDLPVWEDSVNLSGYQTETTFRMELNAINILCGMCEFKSLPVKTYLEVQF